MPMYEYKCDACGYSFEQYSAGKSGEKSHGVCTKCGKGQLKKVFSTFASNCCGTAAGSASGSGGCGNSTFS